MNIEQARFNMIEQQIKPWKVLDEKLLGAMATIPREIFVAESYKAFAYADMAIPLGHNQSMLAPRELARMIQALELKGDEKLLDVGCGSGYSSAILSMLAGKVYAVDIIAEFVQATKKRLKKLSIKNVEVEELDAMQGCPEHAPYDAVLVTSVLPELEDCFMKSLKPGGRLVAIVGAHGKYLAKVFYLNQQQQWSSENLFPVEAKPIINSEQPNRFVF